MTIKDIMQKELMTVTKKDTIEDVLKIMTEKKINGLPVVDENNLLVGMVVKADIYRFMIQPGHFEVCPVDWVMSKKAITSSPDESIQDAAKKLLDHHIIAMPVVEDKKVLGMVSIEDLLQYYSK